MIRPEDVNESNVDQAIDETLTAMRGIVTQARRIEEFSRALANRTGRKEDRRAADQAARAVTELDGAIAEMLKERKEGNGK